MSDPLGLLDEDDPLGLLSDTQKQPWSQVGKRALSGAGKSALEYGKELISPVMHPMQTLKALGTLAAESQVPTLAMRPDSASRILGEHFKDKYGGIENIKESIASHPVGVLGDLAAVTTGVGMATKIPAITRIGTALEPLSMAMAPIKAGTKLIPKIPALSPERLYLSAVKPGFSKKKGLVQLKKEAQAGLSEGILPNEKGLNKLNNLIGEIDERIMGPIEEASKAGKTISKEDALRHVSDVMENAKNLKYNPYPKESLEIIEEATKKFVNEYGDKIDILTAQKAKKAFYSQNRQKYGRQTGATPGEQIVTEKAIARGLKDSIYDSLVEKYPDLKSLGEKEGALINLRAAIEQGSQRIARRDIFGIGVPIKAGVGTVVGAKTGSPTLGTIVGVAAGVLDTPIVKSRLAIALNRANQMKIVNERMAKIRIGSRTIGEATKPKAGGW